MRKSLILLGIFLLIFPLLFLGCEGDDGSTGATGAKGDKGDTGDSGPPGVIAAAPESCSICHHDGGSEPTGSDHQAYYKQLYQDNVIVVTGLAVDVSPDNTVVTTTFTMTKKDSAGVPQPFNCRDADSIGIYHTAYVDPTWEQAGRLSLKPTGNSTPSGTTTTDVVGANCTVTATFNAPIADFRGTDGLVVLYGRDEQLGTLPTRVSQSKYPFAALLPTGGFAIGDYVSAANNDGCEKCHTIPFLKHGYIYGQVDADAATDFYTCKACHQDNGTGGHFIWQLLVNDPRLIITLENEFGEDWEELAANDPRLASYQYTTRLMNDVHMSHAMEFPYPQRMSNCATCHEGKLGAILTDANFVAETCKSCHPVTPAEYADGGNYIDQHRAPAMQTIWKKEGVAAFHDIGMTCNFCHSVAGGVDTFSEIHTGYDKQIYYDAAGSRYSDAITVTIDSASISGNILSFAFSATGSAGGVNAADITPTVLVGLYGWDTKDFLVGPHRRTIDNYSGGPRDLEAGFGSTHPRITITSPAAGSWEATADLSAWADKIADGKIKRAEIGITPRLQVNPPVDNTVIALNAPSRTFSLVDNTFVDNYYQGTAKLVRVEDGCNNCHDALGTTFHNPDRGGNIVICRLCHVTLDDGGHLEMQSRSITSYAHAIHSFQAFDSDEIDFTDPVEALEYEHHTEFVFPTLGIENCEACHTTATTQNPAKYNVPDQSKSLGGFLSGSYTWNVDRNIGTIPKQVIGAAGLACGSCHRSVAINEDDAGELASLFSHWRANGYLLQVPPDRVSDEDAWVVETIEAVMALI